MIWAVFAISKQYFAFLLSVSLKHYHPAELENMLLEVKSKA